MPPKIRELKAQLIRGGFVSRSAKGSHTYWRHAIFEVRLSLSGVDGDDAKPYQEREVRRVLAEVRALREE